MMKKVEREREREMMMKKVNCIHANNMTDGVIGKGAVTSKSILRAFNRVQGDPARRPGTWIHTEIPIALPQAPCYHLQRLHCGSKCINFVSS